MWHRQDVKEAEVVAESVYDPASVLALTDDRKPVPIVAALVGKVGYRFVEKARPPVVKDLGPYWDAKNLVARSITGELTWKARTGCVLIDTARTQAVIGFLSAEPHALGTVSLNSPTRFGAVYVTAMDDREPIRAARRLLITAVGPARNTGMEYETTDRPSRRSGPLWHLKQTGNAPALLEAVTGELLDQERSREGAESLGPRRGRQADPRGARGRAGWRGPVEARRRIRDGLLRAVDRMNASPGDPMASQEPAHEPRRLGTTVRSLLTSRHLPAAAAVLSVCLALPALGVGWILDDYFHRTILLGKSQLRELLGPPSEMFRFFHGDPGRTGQLIDLGLFPWWTDPGLKAEFLQSLTILTHRLDYALWPDSPALMHAHSLLWLGAVVAVTAVFYRRMLGPTWTAGVAAVLFAVDDARGPTVGFLANRNALVAATFGVSALIAHDRWRRDGSRSASLLAPLLLLAALFSKEEGIGACAYLAAFALFVDPGGWRRGCLCLWPYAAVVFAWGGPPGVLGLRRPGRGPLHRPADRHRAIPGGRGGSNPDPPARPVEPDPGGPRRGAIASGRRRHVVDRGGVPRAGLLRDGPAPPPRSPRSLLVRRHALRRDPRLRHAPHGPVAHVRGDRRVRPAGPVLGVRVRRCLRCAVERDLAQSPAVALAWFFVAVHAVAAPIVLPFRAGNPLGPRWVERCFYVRTSLGPSVGDRTLVIVNAPSPVNASYLILLRELSGQSVPRHTRVLAPAVPSVTIRRLDERTIAIRPRGGYLRWPLDRVFRSERRPLALGEQVMLSGMTVTITSLTGDGRPAEAAFRFDVPLESHSLLWLCFRGDRFEPFTPPAVGQEVEIRFDWKAVLDPTD